METLLLIVAVACVLTAGLTSIVAWARLREQHERTAVRAGELRALAFGDDTPAMFGAVAERPASPRRWIAVAAVAVVMTSVAGAAFALHEAPRPQSARLPEPSLELLALRQTTDRQGKFVVTGQVRNASGDRPLQRMTTWVDLYDRHDQFITGNKAPLPYLSARAEAPFTIVVPKTAGVARYRVQFRREDGSVMPHLDHRAPNVANGTERTGHEHLE